MLHVERDRGARPASRRARQRGRDPRQRRQHRVLAASGRDGAVPDESPRGATPPATTIATSSVPERTNARAQSKPIGPCRNRGSKSTSSASCSIRPRTCRRPPRRTRRRTSQSQALATPVIGRPCMSVTTIVTPSNSADTATTASRPQPVLRGRPRRSSRDTLDGPIALVDGHDRSISVGGEAPLPADLHRRAAARARPCGRRSTGRRRTCAAPVARSATRSDRPAHPACYAAVCLHSRGEVPSRM